MARTGPPAGAACATVTSAKAAAASAPGRERGASMDGHHAQRGEQRARTSAAAVAASAAPDDAPPTAATKTATRKTAAKSAPTAKPRAAPPPPKKPPHALTVRPRDVALRVSLHRGVPEPFVNVEATTATIHVDTLAQRLPSQQKHRHVLDVSMPRGVRIRPRTSEAAYFRRTGVLHLAFCRRPAHDGDDGSTQRGTDKTKSIGASEASVRPDERPRRRLELSDSARAEVASDHIDDEGGSSGDGDDDGDDADDGPSYSHANDNEVDSALGDRGDAATVASESKSGTVNEPAPKRMRTTQQRRNGADIAPVVRAVRRVAARFIGDASSRARILQDARIARRNYLIGTVPRDDVERVLARAQRAVRDAKLRDGVVARQIASILNASGRRSTIGASSDGGAATAVGARDRDGGGGGGGQAVDAGSDQRAPSSSSALPSPTRTDDDERRPQGRHLAKLADECGARHELRTHQARAHQANAASTMRARNEQRRRRQLERLKRKASVALHGAVSASDTDVERTGTVDNVGRNATENGESAAGMDAGRAAVRDSAASPPTRSSLGSAAVRRRRRMADDGTAAGSDGHARVASAKRVSARRGGAEDAAGASRAGAEARVARRERTTLRGAPGVQRARRDRRAVSLQLASGTVVSPGDNAPRGAGDASA